MDAVAYREIVIKSAQGYIGQLDAIQDTDKSAAQILSKLYSYVLDGCFDEKLWVRLREATEALEKVRNRDVFCNQYSLGMGNPDAPIVFVGQEWAFNLKSTFNFVTEASFLTLLWLLDVQGKEDLAIAVSRWLWETLKRETIDAQPFHRFPNHYYQKKNLGHTWGAMSNMVKSLLDLSERPQQILAPGQSNFARYCYFVELSVAPAKRHTGFELTPKRREFMPEILKSLPGTQYLIVHGSLGAFRKDEIAYLAMLGVNPTTDFEMCQMLRGKRAWKQYAARDGKRIIFLTQQLASRFSRQTFDKWANWLRQF